MEILKFAAIDIGSNAVRLFFMNVIEEQKTDTAVFLKASLLRVPVRLGEDVFQFGEIRQDKVEKLTHALHAFKHLLSVHDTISYRACATSAMREAVNSKEVIERIKNETGIQIDVIDGDEEAEILYSLKEDEMVEGGRNYLSMDLGGGSCEFTLFSNKKRILSHSFNIGTIRILSNQVSKEEFKFMKVWLKNIAEKYSPLKIIGSGGNINKLFRLSEKKEGTPLPYKKLQHLYEYISSFNIDERIRILELNPDRADVIIPAAKTFLKVMKWTGADEIFVPVLGLADGIIRQEYKKYREGKN